MTAKLPRLLFKLSGLLADSTGHWCYLWIRPLCPTRQVPVGQGPCLFISKHQVNYNASNLEVNHDIESQVVDGGQMMQHSTGFCTHWLFREILILCVYVCVCDCFAMLNVLVMIKTP